MLPVVQGFDLWHPGASVGALFACWIGLAATAEPIRRRLARTCLKTPGGVRRSARSWIHGSLILIASISCGLLGASTRQVDIQADRAVTDRMKQGAFATFSGVLCDASVLSPNSGPGPRSPPVVAGRARTDLIRSITVCTSGSRRPQRIRVTFFRKRLSADRLHMGDRVLITGRPVAPRSAENPFGFDEKRWLTRLGIQSVVRDPARIRLVHDHSSVRSRAWWIRARLRGRIHSVFEYRRHRALATAVLLGDRADIDSELNDRFVRSGLMHLLALSGLHVGLIGGVVYVLIDSVLRRLSTIGRLRRLTRTVMWAIAMGTYGTVVGWPVSVVRAIVMTAAFLAVSTAGRQVSPWQILGLAASSLLILSPGHLYDAGFQLSFSAVGGLILVRPEKDPHPALVNQRGDAVRWLIRAVRSSMAAGIATMPVLLYHFGSAPTAGILLSPPGILLMGPLLVSTILSVSIPSAAAAPFGHAAAAGFDALTWLGGVDPAWLPEITTMPGQWSTVLALPGLAGAALWLGGGRRRFRLMMAACVAAFTLLIAGALDTPRGPLHRIVFFSAGQGDAALVHSAGGHTMLIDASPGSVRPALDYAERAGIERIDLAVLTHSHHDHVGGLAALARQIPIDRIIHTGWAYSTGSSVSRTVRAGDTLEFGSDVRVQVLSPDVIRDSHGNEDSIVLRLRIGDVRLLFMGDAETETESRLSRRYGRFLEAEIVKAGHHGSDTSSSAGFVQTTRPEIVVVSAGKNNRFNHPSSAVVARWKSVAARVHVTAERGALVVRTNGIDVDAQAP